VLAECRWTVLRIEADPEWGEWGAGSRRCEALKHFRPLVPALKALPILPGIVEAPASSPNSGRGWRQNSLPVSFC